LPVEVYLETTAVSELFRDGWIATPNYGVG
jgi:hypothetical protein